MNKTLTIKNRQGALLHAEMDFPIDQKAEFFALFAHCFTCSSQLKAVKHISRALTQQGFGVIRFDFTGLGKSEGAFKDSHFSANIEDLIDVHQYIGKHFKPPELLIGHSLGGAAVIAAAQELSEVKAISTIASPATVDHVKHLLKPQRDSDQKDGLQQISIGDRDFYITEEFIQQLNRIDLLNTVAELKKPYLILHAPFDKIVSIENAQQLYHHAFHPKSFVSLDQADHLLTNKEDALYVGKIIGTWVQRYFPKKNIPSLSTFGQQLVAYLDIDEEGYTTQMRTNNHSLLADEPLELGGNDYAPSPIDHLLAALASCTTITLKMYAQRKKWNLEEVFVYVDFNREKIQNENGDTVLTNKISKKIKLVGPLEEDQKKRLLQISAKCPVHKVLIEGSDINSILIE